MKDLFFIGTLFVLGFIAYYLIMVLLISIELIIHNLKNRKK